MNKTNQMYTISEAATWLSDKIKDQKFTANQVYHLIENARIAVSYDAHYLPAQRIVNEGCKDGMRLVNSLHDRYGDQIRAPSTVDTAGEVGRLKGVVTIFGVTQTVAECLRRARGIIDSDQLYSSGGVRVFYEGEFWLLLELSDRESEGQFATALRKRGKPLNYRPITSLDPANLMVDQFWLSVFAAGRRRGSENVDSDGGMMTESAVLQRLLSQAEVLIKEFPNWKGTLHGKPIQNTGNLMGWIKQTTDANTRDAEKLKEFLIEKYPDLKKR